MATNEGMGFQKAAYDEVRLQALKEVLVPGSTWSLAEDGGNFQYVCSPSSTGLRWRRAQQQQQQQEELVTGRQQQCEQLTTEHLQVSNRAANPDRPNAAVWQPATTAAAVNAAAVGDSAAEPADDGAAVGGAQQQQVSGASGAAAEPELMASSMWLQQQLQQVYKNPLLQVSIQNCSKLFNTVQHYCCSGRAAINSGCYLPS